MTATILKYHQHGARVSIMTAGGNTVPGTVEGTVANVHEDDWPEYRVDVIGDDGRHWYGCHPNCILPLDTPEVAA